jgi:hypothetical protein
MAALAVLAPSAAHADMTKAELSVTPDPAAQCQPVTLDASGSNLDGNALFTTIAWNTGSGWGTPINLPPGLQPGFPPPYQDLQDTVTFANPGTYTVGVRLTDTLGAVSTATATVTATGVPSPTVPVPLFGSSTTVALVGRAITFNGSASYEASSGGCNSSSPVVSNMVGSYTWNFGDGTPPAQGPVVSHAFSVPGTYNVVLVVASTDPAGGIASATHAVTIIAPPGPAAPPPARTLTPGAVTLPSGRIKVVARGSFSLRVRCQAGSAGCAGELQVISRRQDVLSPLVFASGRFSVAAGKSALVKLRLSREGRRELNAAHSKGLLVRLSAFPPGAAVTVQPASGTIRLVPATSARKPHRRPRQKRR